MDPDQTVEKIILSVRREIYFVSKRTGDKFEISLKNLRDPTRRIRRSINLPRPPPGHAHTNSVARDIILGHISVSSDFRSWFNARYSDFDAQYYPKSFYREHGYDAAILDDIESDKDESDVEEDEDDDDGSTVFEREANENGERINDIQLIHKACKVKFFSQPFVTCWVRCGLQDKNNDEYHEDDDHCLMYSENSELFPPWEVDYMLGIQLPVFSQDIDDYTLFDGMPAVYSKSQNTITVFSIKTRKIQSRTNLPSGTSRVIFLNEPWKVVVTQTEGNTSHLAQLVTEKQMRMYSTCLALSLQTRRKTFPEEVLKLVWEFLE